MRYRILLLLALVGACGNSSPVNDAPDDVTPPEGVIESTQPPAVGSPGTVPGPLTDDAVGYLISAHLPGNFLGPGVEGEMFCAYDLYGWEQTVDVAEAWIWVYCGEYHLHEGELALGTAGVGPLTVHMAEVADGWTVSSLDQPKLGGLYADSVRKMFPTEHADRVLSNNETDRDLRAEAEQKARSQLAG